MNLKQFYLENIDNINYGDLKWTTDQKTFKHKHLNAQQDIHCCDYCHNHRCWESRRTYKRWGGKSWKLYRKTQYKC